MTLSRTRGVKFASIDIGSNAVRLLLARVFENGGDPQFRKESLVRIPIRLGEDVFATGGISEQKRQSLLCTMVGYKNLMQAYGSVDYIACATSAMREASNGQEVMEAIRTEAGIELTIIDGRREAEVICRNHPITNSDKDRRFLYVDVGGGSTELAVFADNHVLASSSFQIGGVRILSDRVDKNQWKEMKRWIREFAEPHQPLVGVGSGGNINKAFSLARKKEGETFTYKKLNSIYKTLRSHSYEELVQSFNMRPDRADVIVPALEIYLSVMKWAEIEEMVVPVRGLSDGLIHLLYDKYRNGHDHTGTDA